MRTPARGDAQPFASAFAMTAHFDARETRDPAAREQDLLARLPGLIEAARAAPGWRTQLGDIDPGTINSRAALARLPLLRKSDLIGLQQSAPPFAGFVPGCGLGSASNALAASGANSSHTARDTAASVSAAASSATRFFNPSRSRTSGALSCA